MCIELSCSSKAVGEEIIEVVTSEIGLIGGARLIGGIPLEILGAIVPFMIEDQIPKIGNLAIHDLPVGRVKGGMRRSLMMEKLTHLGV